MPGARTGPCIHQLVLPCPPPCRPLPPGNNRAQLFNLAYARHEIISDHTDACLAWLEAGGATPVDQLLQ